MLNESEQEMIKKLRMKLMEIEGTIRIYDEELMQRRFKPRGGERWERTIEKYIVTSATLLRKNNAQLLDGFFELTRINSLAREAKIVGEDTGRSSQVA